MTELQILSDITSYGMVNQKKTIEVEPIEDEVIYKFLIGINGIWRTIQNYSPKNKCEWVPTWKGVYTVMVQAKKKQSKKPFDYMTKSQIEIKENVDCTDKTNEEKSCHLIKDVLIEKDKCYVGEKINIQIISNEENLFYRFWINGKQGWEELNEYSEDSTFTITTNKQGKYEVLAECKRKDSYEKFDDFTTISFEVVALPKTVINKFLCLSSQRIVNDELSFKVNTTLDMKRSILYKFVKINTFGEKICIKDYSSENTVSFIEKVPGKYKLLCLVRDMLSNNEYDDRAVMIYSVKPYKAVKLNDIITDVLSPQVNQSIINIKAYAEGGNELLYRFIIDGSSKEDSGFIRSNEYAWNSDGVGEYTITVLVRDISCTDEYEAEKTIPFIITESGTTPVRIVDIISENKCVQVGNAVNIKLVAEGGIDLKYAFIVYKDKVPIEKTEYSAISWIDFIPEEKGNYEIEARIKDKYSIKEYDNNCFINISARDYVKGKIDYILVQGNDKHVIGDTVVIESIVQNTEKILMKYTMKIDGRKVEETNYSMSKKIILKPKSAGKYSFTIFCKNIKSEEKYDDKKEMNIYIYENKPVINTKISYNIDEIKVNEEVTFHVNSVGGKDVCYEFYIMENGNWVKVQDYSRKNYYTFIPFVKGEHRIMVMAKSYYKKVNYEDYDEMEFNVV